MELHYSMCPCHVLSDPTEKRPFLKVKFPQVEKKFSLILRNPKLYYGFHRIPVLFSHPESDENILRLPILFLENAF